METSNSRLRAISRMLRHTTKLITMLQTLRPKLASDDERTRRAPRYVGTELVELMWAPSGTCATLAYFYRIGTTTTHRLRPPGV